MNTPLEILEKYWGFSSFRHKQEEIISSVLKGKDTLALLPTGGGKSLCYQIPALAKEGICIVVSPLISLMNDQVSKLNSLGIKSAAIYSGLNKYEIDIILDNCIYGEYKFLYVSPERLKTEIMIVRSKKMNINLLAIDEAHCISKWGYDFRPAYLEISEFRETLDNDIPCIALTATATKLVREDIGEKLLLKDKNEIIASFYRPNLGYVVLKDNYKYPSLLNLINKIQGSAIVYVRTRKQSVELSKYLRSNAISAGYYHAGMSTSKRETIQSNWKENKLRIIVSTNAFGMGIDKSDVRLVVHFEMPGSIEAYYQEAGRGGRDGKRSYAVLLYNENDIESLNRMFDISNPDRKLIKRTYMALASYFQLATGSGYLKEFDFNIHEFCKIYSLDPLSTYHSIKILQENGLIKMTESFYKPSTIRIISSKEEMYSYLLRNGTYKLLIKTLLRTFEGINIGAVRIYEKKLAKLMGMDLNYLKKALFALNRDEIIQYSQSTESPKIVFLMERISGNNFRLDSNMLKVRKNVKREELDAMIAYVKTDDCRSKYLLDYFEEKNSVLCGICDFCRAKKRKGVSIEDINNYSKKIHGLLKKNDLSVKELCDSFLHSRHKIVMETLDYLISEKIVSQIEDILHWND